MRWPSVHVSAGVRFGPGHVTRRPDVCFAASVSSGGSVTTTVTCPVRGDCAATLYVLRAGQVKGHLARAGSHVARRKRRVAPYLGRASFVVAAGRKRKIVIHLKKRARRLARAGRLKKVELLLITRGHKPRVVTVRLHRKRH